MNVLYALRRLRFLLAAVRQRLQFLLLIVRTAYHTDVRECVLGKLDKWVAFVALVLFVFAITPFFGAGCIPSATFGVLNLAVVIFCIWNLVKMFRAALRLTSGNTFAVIFLQQSLSLAYEMAIREAIRDFQDRPCSPFPIPRFRALRGELINDLFNPARDVAYAAFVIFGLHFTFAVLLASLLAYGATAHFQLCDAFHGISLQDSQSFLRHVYYVMVTFVTVGYGDVFPASGNYDYGSCFGIFLCFQVVGLLVMGASALFSASLYRIQQLPSDVDNWMKEIGAPV